MKTEMKTEMKTNEDVVETMETSTETTKTAKTVEEKFVPEDPNMAYVKIWDTEARIDAQSGKPLTNFRIITINKKQWYNNDKENIMKFIRGRKYPQYEILYEPIKDKK